MPLLLGALPDRLGTGADSILALDSDACPGADRLAVVVARVLPALEYCLRAANAMEPDWVERREAWFTGLRGALDFDLKAPPPELMSYEEAEAAVEEAAEAAETAIEWSVSPDALVAASKLGVARGARLVSVALAGLDRDPERLTLTQFLAATPTATHKGVLAVSAPGTVVALIRKGMRLTRERYVADPYPDAWVPMKELRPAERCVVRAAAFRGYRAPPPEFPGVSGTPPCVWLLLELLDPGMIVPHDRRTKLGRAASASAAARRGPGWCARRCSRGGTSPSTSSSGTRTPPRGTGRGRRARGSRCSSRT